MTSRQRALGACLTVLSTAALLPVAGARAASTAPSTPGRSAVAAATTTSLYAPLTPTRALDTRAGAKLGAGGTTTVQVTGRFGVPAGASAVVLNLTAVAPSAATYLSVYPAAGVRPTVSSLNVAAGETRANLVTVPLSRDGRVTIYNASGSTHVLADVSGYLRPVAANPNLSGYLDAPPARLFDSRVSGFGPVPAHGYRDIDIRIPSNEPITAVAINLTAVAAGSSGYLTAYSGTGAVPGASTLNFGAGATVPNMALVPVRRSGSSTYIRLVNASATPLNVIVDGLGVFSPEMPFEFVPLTPKRVLDSRTGNAPLGAGATRTVSSTPAGVDPWTSYVVVGNATAITPTAPTYLTLWAGSPDARPVASNVNAAKGQTVANSTWTSLSASGNGTFAIYNSVGSTHVAYDVTGAWVDQEEAAYGGATTSRTRPWTAAR